ncbi:MAG: hypothetical protein P4M07_12420 [Xanthobacteraceae bacterium]|nr:hypothetical protein [Xanthobacteraceae bacterium]
MAPKPAAEPADDADDDTVDEKPAADAALPDPATVDWSALTAAPGLAKAAPRRPASGGAANGGAVAWSHAERPDGSAALTVKQPLLPLWDTRVGADFSVAGPSQPAPLPATLGRPQQSSGTAWAATTAPGLGPIWDKTAVEARLDPAQDQGKLGTSISKAIPLGDSATTLMLRGGYNITDQAALPAFASPGRPQYNYGADRSAKLQFSQTGTSLIAGQSLSPAEDRWLRSVGAEQSLFGGVNINAMIGETASGNLNKSLTAGFKKTW